MKTSSSFCQLDICFKKKKKGKLHILKDDLMPLPVFAANRPKSLLVYINPFGGKRRGKRIYEQKVAPMFRLAGIATTVIGESLSVAFLNI